MKSKILTIGLILMLLINATLIFILVQGPPRPSHKNAGSLMEEISQKLGLSEEQKMQYQTLARQHREAMNGIDKLNMDIAKDYYSTLKIGNESDSDSLLQKLLELERSKQQLTYHHFADLKALCTPEQLPKFNTIIDNILQVLIPEKKKNQPPPRDR
jgi:protein CpxP